MPWSSYRGYMHCKKSPNHKHQMIVKGRKRQLFSDSQLWMWCSLCRWAHTWDWCKLGFHRPDDQGQCIECGDWPE